MFKVKFMLVLALLALVVKDEVKCTMMDELIADLSELSPTLIKDSAALDEGADKQGAIESGTQTEVAEDIVRVDEIEEEIHTGTFSEKEEAIKTGTFKDAPTGPVKTIGNNINEAICGTKGNTLSKRIIGGANARPGDWPWQVAFVKLSNINQVFCGGTLISNDWIVSAASCFTGRDSSTLTAPSTVLVRLGAHDIYNDEGREQDIAVKNIIIHPQFNMPFEHNNDIALIQLSKKATINEYVRPACVPSSDFVINSGTMATISGWGLTSNPVPPPQILHVAQVPIVGSTTCKKIYTEFTCSMICAGYANGGIDACPIDDGGPLVVKSGGKYYVIGVTTKRFQGCYGLPRHPGIYAKITFLRAWIDSVLSNPDPVPTPSPATGDLTCNFEKDLCKWTQSKTDKFDWTRRKGATPNIHTGPYASSTGANGHYMYIATSYPRQSGDTATLISPEIDYATQTCLSFKAHINGATISTFRIEKVVGASRTKIFEKSGEQGCDWLSFNVDLPIGGPYKVAITATCGPPSLGVIAIDELKHVIDSCAPPSDPLQSASCNFEKDLCKWTQSTADQFDWKRNQGKTPTDDTGPSESSTDPKGHYLYIETSFPRKNGDKAIITSPDILSYSKACLRFQAHMFGSSIGTLQIETVEGNTRKTIFSKSGSRHNKWHSYHVDLPAGGPYKVEITGYRAESYTGDIAIDELLVTPKAC